MRDTDDSGLENVLAAGSALALAFGVVMGLVILAGAGEVIVFFLLLSVFPALLGYAGLEYTDYLPRRASGGGGSDDLVDELKRRYARGELDEAEMERKVEALLAAEEGTTSRERERERERF
jgi:uncharacterized membrane protein